MLKKSQSYIVALGKLIEQNNSFCNSFSYLTLIKQRKIAMVQYVCTLRFYSGRLLASQ